MRHLHLAAARAALALCLAAPTARAQYLHGYLGVPNEAPGLEFGGGYSMYVAAWPLLEEWPGSRFQTGLFGTWMHAQKPEPAPEGELYSDIEGGLGWWRDTRFATATPKFIMGGVGLNFAAWANGPGAGKGRDWDRPQGKYGIAQLSPWVVWPPDGLNLAQGTCGELFGYGYLPLPLTEPKDVTAGHDVPTGNQCWTLFLATANFKGPVAFFTPYFFSRHTVERPDLAGLFLDARPADPRRALQMETQYVPAALASGAAGETWARCAPTRFPANAPDGSLLVHAITSYRRAALWDAVRAWFDGGAPASGRVDPDAGHVHRIPGHGWSTWQFAPEGGATRADERELDWAAFAAPCALDAATFGYRWDAAWVTAPAEAGPRLFTLPDTYALPPAREGAAALRWAPRAAPETLAARGLAQVAFGRPRDHRPEPYVTPDDGCWATPGPAAGPFRAVLGDGSTITYCWYRFADQPALLNADLGDAEREELQRRVELLHRAWTREREYLPPPARGALASLDPALLVEPPAGLEVGYVPICTRQGRD
ncbi:MAG: hypothetical protein H6828_15575 [Planctomycetes bacterium]|nr:hypothetical protein [Planctomycetota bacterium]